MANYSDMKSVLYKYYVKNHHKGRTFIFDLFTELGAPKRSLNRWLTLLENNQTLSRKSGSGKLKK